MGQSEDQLKALMIGGLDGDAAAHAALLRALVPLLERFYRRRLAGSNEVDDLVQETLIACMAAGRPGIAAAPSRRGSMPSHAIA